MVFGGNKTHRGRGPFGGNVIGIGAHLMQGGFPQISEVEAYWTALKGSRQVPERLEIDPRGIEGALSHAFLVERIAPGIARLRLAGSHLNDLMGMDVRGMPLSALIAPQNRGRFADYLEQVFSAPARLIMDLSAERALGKPKCQARLIILPLTDRDNRITQALGCLCTQGCIGRAPRRFVMAAQNLHPLSGAVPLPRATPNQIYSMAEPPQPFDQPDQRHPNRTARHPYLRLVQPEG
ncbi:PAS domain-containing protein [Thalassovita litoralis]|jgi:hypothetical protein|uniref:PAS domain-containing protein n=1 Tax=Thalassovita litoralis TaxID=1010611 RepID=A0A521BVY9_9RHOB|nr:PAS domain-containing protein [Thalassovita litoralis]SMO51353.1 PAS domain-containing protein [Thalassovita litoralis]